MRSDPPSLPLLSCCWAASTVLAALLEFNSDLAALSTNATCVYRYCMHCSMMEIGNQGDFKSDRGMILVHFTYWIITKSNLLLSTLLDELPDDILQIVKNKEALA